MQKLQRGVKCGITDLSVFKYKITTTKPKIIIEMKTMFLWKFSAGSIVDPKTQYVSKIQEYLLFSL